jgi:tetratricopeptide (TPR) repeat protein
MLQDRGLHALAATAYRRCREIAPTGAWAGAAYANEGSVARRIGDSDLAVQLFRQAIEVDPVRATNHFNYAAMLLELRRWAEAAAAADAGAKLSASEPALRQTLHEMAAAARVESGDGAGGLRSADEALAVEPARGRLYVLRGRALMLLNRLDEAETSFERALAMDPRDVEAATFRDIVQSASATAAGPGEWAIKL